MAMNEGLAAIRHSGDDAKRKRILEGAFGVFLAYGFSRTTMDDIARAAELSRPALYLVFKNKTDIYRAIARCVLAQCVERAQAALDSPGTLLERLDRLVENALYETMRDIEEAPHGPELLDMKNSLAGDILEEWRGQMEAALQRAVSEETAASGVDLAARGFSESAVARTFFDALEGMRPRFSDPSDHLRAARLAARMLVAAIRP
jgi:AcrR family transcriptional regulator